MSTVERKGFWSVTILAGLTLTATTLQCRIFNIECRISNAAVGLEGDSFRSTFDIRYSMFDIPFAPKETCGSFLCAAASADEKEKPLKLPDGWNPNDPLPIVKSNCVRCHLTAGRELTTPVRDFARSIHDRVKLSCNDCHGGNAKEDIKAHEEEFHFIGTKLSAHMEACTDCHRTETEGYRTGKHHWDLAKWINRKYPLCVDCHGNHDVAKPPAEFAMMNVCTDCHKTFEKDMAATASVVREHDELWKTLRTVHAKNIKEADPTPEAFRKDLKRVRTATSLLIHRARPLTEEEAKRVNDRSMKLRNDLAAWLK